MTRTASLLGGGAARALLAVPLLLGTAVSDSPESSVPPDGLTGSDIYNQVVDNRFHSFTQQSRLISADRTGRSQESRFDMRWKNFRDEDGNPIRGVMSKTLVKYTYPFELRHAGYLIQANHNRVNDQFVYYPSRRRVVRVNLRSEAVYGSDFSFEDVIPREAEDFVCRRLPDEVFERFPVYVVDLTPSDFADSEYSKIRVFVDKQRPVVLRARYWNAAGVEVKEFIAEPEQIRHFDGVWVPMTSTMRNLLLDSYTKLVVTALVPNPEFGNEAFDLGRLEAH